MFSLLVALLFTVTTFAQRSPLEEFGTTGGRPVDNGFVFLDSQYLQPPYAISRKGLTLYVNDAKVEPSDLLRTKRALSAEPNYALWTVANRRKLLAKIEHLRAEYETRLQEGACYFFFSEGGDISMKPYSVAYELPGIVEDLRSGKPIEEKLQSIRRMNWHLNVGDQKVAKLVARFSAPGDLEARLSDLAEQLLRVKDFGITDGSSIEKGFVFYNGTYVDAPYTVVRRGLGILVNDVLVRRPPEWPPPIFSQEEDPMLPEWIVKDSSLEDLRDHLVKKYRYLISHYSEEETISRYVKYVRNLPCVKEVRHTTDISVELTSFSGETWPVNLSASLMRRVQAVKRDKNSFLQRAESQRKYYEEGLLRGDCFLIFTGGEVTLPASVAADKLEDMVEILRSSKSVPEKYKELQQLGICINESSFPLLVTNFSSSPQLEARLNDLKKPKEDK